MNNGENLFSLAQALCNNPVTLLDHHLISPLTVAPAAPGIGNVPINARVTTSVSVVRLENHNRNLHKDIHFWWIGINCMHGRR